MEAVKVTYDPGKVTYGSSGQGSPAHFGGVMLEEMAGIKMIHVPYKGNAPAYADLRTGRIQLILADRLSAQPHLQSGALRPIAVTSTARNDALANVPTVAETVPGYEASAFYGFAAPKGTPPEILDALNRAINAALADPKIQARFAELDATALVFSRTEFAAFLEKEAARWGEAVRRSGAKPSAQ